MSLLWRMKLALISFFVKTVGLFYIILQPMPIFLSLKPNKGKIAGSTAKKEMVKSRLPNPVLAKVWRLADVDGDGALDSDEFALAMHLIHIKLDGFDMPDQLPDHLVPPSKKKAMMEAAAKAAANHVDPNQVSNKLL